MELLDCENNIDSCFIETLTEIGWHDPFPSDLDENTDKNNSKIKKKKKKKDIDGDSK